MKKNTSAYAAQYALLLVALDMLVATKQTMAYSTLASIIGIGVRDTNYYRMLNQSMREDVESDDVPRAALVINKQTMRPGEGFYEEATRLNLLGPTAQEQSKEMFFVAVLERLGVPVPTFSTTKTCPE